MNNQNIADCMFCQFMSTGRVVVEYGSVFAILDKYPVTPRHHLVITKRHVSDYFEMSFIEKRDAEALLSLLRKQILKDDPTVQGFNVGMNCGEVAGQTVMHAHIHLIPRRIGDAAEPRGGVRGCVPGKMGY
jgi:diadenosine tetraphosphate (Ap4A) HIT family hydrolase